MKDIIKDDSKYENDKYCPRYVVSVGSYTDLRNLSTIQKLLDIITKDFINETDILNNIKDTKDDIHIQPTINRYITNYAIYDESDLQVYLPLILNLDYLISEIKKISVDKNTQKKIFLTTVLLRFFDMIHYITSDLDTKLIENLNCGSIVYNKLTIHQNENKSPDDRDFFNIIPLAQFTMSDILTGVVIPQLTIFNRANRCLTININEADCKKIYAYILYYKWAITKFIDISNHIYRGTYNMSNILKLVEYIKQYLNKSTTVLDYNLAKEFYKQKENTNLSDQLKESPLDLYTQVSLMIKENGKFTEFNITDKSRLFTKPMTETEKILNQNKDKIIKVATELWKRKAGD